VIPSLRGGAPDSLVSVKTSENASSRLDSLFPGSRGQLLVLLLLLLLARRQYATHHMPARRRH